MTKKVYKTAQGKSVDLGTIMLQNEKTRAVGNMNVNARGDLLGSGNKVIETKNRQIQRQNNRTSVPAAVPVQTSTNKVRQSNKTKVATKEEKVKKTHPVKQPTPAVETPTMETVVVESPTESVIEQGVQPVIVTEPPVQDVPASGLAAAIARSKIIKQEKEKTARELAQSKPGVRKI